MSEKTHFQVTVHTYLDPDKSPTHLVEDDTELAHVCRVLRDTLESLPPGGAVVIRKAMPPAPAPAPRKRLKGTK